MACLVQNNTTIWGNTVYIGSPTYEKHAAKESLMLQDHGNAYKFSEYLDKRIIISKISFMKSFFILPLLFAILSCTAQSPDQETVFTKVNVIPMNEEKVIKNQDVVVQNGII